MKKWKRFERVAAALHALQMSGATVTWDDHITGYQIDVSVRFTKGPYTHLLIVECRDQGRPVSRDDLAAFVIKREQTQADKGVLVSASGFQSGARELAELKGIEAFVLEEIPDDWPETIQVSIARPIVGIKQILFLQKNGSWRMVPDEIGPRFYSQARFADGRGRVLSVDQVIQPFAPSGWREMAGPWNVHVTLPGEWILNFPGAVPVPVDAVHVRAETLPGLSFEAKQPAEMRTSTFVYRNTKTDREDSVPDKEIPFGFDTVIEAGGFYEDIGGGRYYCESADGDSIRLVLLGSTQHGKRLWAEIVVALKDAQGHYVGVADTAVLDALAADLEMWREAKRKGLTRKDFVADLAKGAVYLPPGST